MRMGASMWPQPLPGKTAQKVELRSSCIGVGLGLGVGLGVRVRVGGWS